VESTPGRGAPSPFGSPRLSAFSYIASQAGCTEVNAEPPAPDRYRAILAQVQSLGHVVVLVTDVPFKAPQIHDACRFAASSFCTSLAATR